MDGAVYRGVGEEGHGQGHHACSVNIHNMINIFICIQRTHDHEEVEHVVLHHVPPGSAVQCSTIHYNAVQTLPHYSESHSGRKYGNGGLALSNSFVPESSTQELKEYIQFNVNFTINCVNMERNEGRNITLHFCHT